jgi:hypothetical protein
VSARPPARPTADAFFGLIERFDKADQPLRGGAYSNGGLDALFPRLARVYNAVAAFAEVQGLLDKGDEK